MLEVTDDDKSTTSSSVTFNQGARAATTATVPPTERRQSQALDLSSDGGSSETGSSISARAAGVVSASAAAGLQRQASRPLEITPETTPQGNGALSRAMMDVTPQTKNLHLDDNSSNASSFAAQSSPAFQPATTAASAAPASKPRGGVTFIGAADDDEVTPDESPDASIRFAPAPAVAAATAGSTGNSNVLSFTPEQSRIGGNAAPLSFTPDQSRIGGNAAALNFTPEQSRIGGNAPALNFTPEQSRIGGAAAASTNSDTSPDFSLRRPNNNAAAAAVGVAPSIEEDELEDAPDFSLRRPNTAPRKEEDDQEELEDAPDFSLRPRGGAAAAASAPAVAAPPPQAAEVTPISSASASMLPNNSSNNTTAANYSPPDLRKERSKEEQMLFAASPESAAAAAAAAGSSPNAKAHDDDDIDELSDDDTLKKVNSRAVAAPAAQAAAASSVVAAPAAVAAPNAAVAPAGKAEDDDLAELSDDEDTKKKAAAAAPAKTEQPVAATPATAAPAVPPAKSNDDDLAELSSDDEDAKKKPAAPSTSAPAAATTTATTAVAAVVPKATDDDLAELSDDDSLARANSARTAAPKPSEKPAAATTSAAVDAAEVKSQGSNSTDPLGGIGDSASSASSPASRGATAAPQPAAAAAATTAATTTPAKKKPSAADDSDDISSMGESDLQSSETSSSAGPPAAAIAARMPSMRRRQSTVVPRVTAENEGAAGGPRTYIAGAGAAHRSDDGSSSQASNDVFNIADDTAIAVDLQRFARAWVAVAALRRKQRERIRRWRRALAGHFACFASRNVAVAARVQLVARRLSLESAEARARAPLAALLLYEASELVGRDWIVNKWIAELIHAHERPFAETRQLLQDREESRGGAEAGEASGRASMIASEARIRVDLLQMQFAKQRDRIEEQTAFALLERHFAIENGEHRERVLDIAPQAVKLSFEMAIGTFLQGREQIARDEIVGSKSNSGNLRSSWRGGWDELFRAHRAVVASSEMSAALVRAIGRFEKEEGFRRADVESSYANHMRLYTNCERTCREETLARVQMQSGALVVLARAGSALTVHLAETAARQRGIEAQQRLLFAEMQGRYAAAGRSTWDMLCVRQRLAVEIAALQATAGELAQEEHDGRQAIVHAMRRSIPLFRDWGCGVSVVAALHAEYRREAVESTEGDTRMHARNARHVCELIVATMEGEDAGRSPLLGRSRNNPQQQQQVDAETTAATAAAAAASANSTALVPRPPTVPARLAGGIRTSAATRSIVAEVPAFAAHFFMDARAVSADLDCASKSAVDKRDQLLRQPLFVASPAVSSRSVNSTTTAAPPQGPLIDAKVFPYRFMSGRRAIELRMLSRTFYTQHAQAARGEFAAWLEGAKALIGGGDRVPHPSPEMLARAAEAAAAARVAAAAAAAPLQLSVSPASPLSSRPGTAAAAPAAPAAGGDAKSDDADALDELSDDETLKKRANKSTPRNDNNNNAALLSAAAKPSAKDEKSEDTFSFLDSSKEEHPPQQQQQPSSQQTAEAAAPPSPPKQLDDDDVLAELDDEL